MVQSIDHLPDRAAYYAARLLSGQGDAGDRYDRIKRAYQVFFVNEILFPGSTKLPRRYYFREEEEGDRLTEMVEVIFYELPKVTGLPAPLRESVTCPRGDILRAPLPPL